MGLSLPRTPLALTVTLLVVELLDELVYGAQGASLPLIRSDLQLSYVQVGLLLSLPGYVSNALDPFIGLLGDTRLRRGLMIAGVGLTALALLLIAGGHGFWALVLAFCLAAPAGTAYVSLGQATLMDLNPGRQDQAMARWTVAGALGQLVGPTLIAGAVAWGLGWRGVYVGLAAVAVGATVAMVLQPLGRARISNHAGGLLPSLRDFPQAIRSSGLLRWMALLELSDLLLDVLYVYCALYFTDEAGASPALAGLAVSVLALGGLVGDMVLVPVLEKIDGLRLLRVTAPAALMVYIALLLVPGIWAKFALLAILAPLRSGWYQVLQGRAYASMPERSGAVVAIGSLGGLVASSFPLLIGAVAEAAGLRWAMALLAIGPLALWIGVRKRSRTTGSG